MRRAVFLGFVLLSGCGSDPATEPPVQQQDDALSFHFEADVGAGQEVLRCAFIQMPADRGAMHVGSIDHVYTAGSHHFLVYRTGLSSIPKGAPTALTDCDETGWLSKVRGVAYAAQDPKGQFLLPDGVAQSFDPNEVLLVQTHYLNGSAQDLHATIDFSMHLLDADKPVTEAGVLFFFNPAIYIDPQAASTAELTCPVPTDVHLAFAASHMHKRAVGFRAESSDAAVSSALGPLYETDNWEEPVPRVFTQEPPALLPAGSSIKYHCDYQNPDTFGVAAGPSADTDEMCMFVAMYWPRASEDVEFCRDGLVTGTGTASGAETLGCITSCAGQSAECRGKCMTDACPNVPMKLAPFAQCISDNCPACAQDSKSTDCTSCVAASCASAYKDLTSATCN